MKIILKFLLVVLIMWPVYARSQEPPPPAAQGKVQPGGLKSEANAKSDIKTKGNENGTPKTVSPTNKMDTQGSSATPKNADKKNGDTKPCTTNDGSITTYTLWLMIFTGFLVVCNILLWLYTKKAADAAKKSADALPTIERAYLFAEVGKPEHVDRNIFNIPIKISNFGKTPAIVIKCGAAYVWAERCPSVVPHFKGQMPDGVAVVAPGEWTGIKIPTSDIPPDVLGAIGRGEVKSICCGRVEYHDIWEVIKHETGFCWEVNPITESAISCESPLNYRT